MPNIVEPPFDNAHEERATVLSIVGKGICEEDCIDAHIRDRLERQRQIESEPLLPNIAAVLDEAADEVPDQIAWNFFEDGISQTYRQVRENVNRLASAFDGLGIRKGTHVGVMLPDLRSSQPACHRPGRAVPAALSGPGLLSPHQRPAQPRA